MVSYLVKKAVKYLARVLVRLYQLLFLVKNPEKRKGKATIQYHDIGDYLSREQKLKKDK